KYDVIVGKGILQITTIEQNKQITTTLSKSLYCFKLSWTRIGVERLHNSLRCFCIPVVFYTSPQSTAANATLNSRLARLAASRSLAYVIAHAAIVICCCIFNAILTND
ncbi:hypothetical protein L9F63_006450, partial [Diploptera punctata]